MRLNKFIYILILAALAGLVACSSKDENKRERIVSTEALRDSLSPQNIIDLLKDGNSDFVKGEWRDWDYLFEQEQTASGQYPMAVILSCIDSRAPAEIIFNLGIGDIFNARVAGNFVNTDIAGSMEYGCKVAGSKVIVVMGHSNCGAVKSACDGVELGNITSLLSNILPAVESTLNIEGERNSGNKKFVETVAKKNVLNTIDNIRMISPILTEMEINKEIKMVGAMYDVKTGKVEFFN